MNQQLEMKKKYLKEIALKKVQILNVDKEKLLISNSITNIQKTNDKLSLQKSKMDDNKNLKMKISNFIMDKDLEKNLHYAIKHLKRKHDVIDFKYRNASRYFKKK